MSFFHKGVFRVSGTTHTLTLTHTHTHTWLLVPTARLPRRQMPSFHGEALACMDPSEGCCQRYKTRTTAGPASPVGAGRTHWQPWRGSGLCSGQTLHRPRGPRRAAVGMCALWWQPGPVVGQGESGAHLCCRQEIHCPLGHFREVTADFTGSWARPHGRV